MEKMLEDGPPQPNGQAPADAGPSVADGAPAEAEQQPAGQARQGQQEGGAAATAADAAAAAAVSPPQTQAEVSIATGGLQLFLCDMEFLSVALCPSSARIPSISPEQAVVDNFARADRQSGRCKQVLRKLVDALVGRQSGAVSADQKRINAMLKQYQALAKQPGELRSEADVISCMTSRSA